MIKVIGIYGDIRFERDYSEYWQALTAAIQLQNKGFTVEMIKENND